jgi:SAM-dependent methyltransferase
VDPISQDLARWMPRLIGIFRTARHARGPSDRLTPPELQLVSRGVRRLSEGLTRGRRLVGAHYMDDPEALAAYLLYYWPVSYAQGRHVYRELGTKPRMVLDLGSGPGPLAMAAFDAGATEVMAADRSVNALELAKKIADASGRMLSTRAWDPLKGTELPGGNLGWNAISMGHAINELWADAPDRIERRAALCEQLLSKLRKGGSLILIEPALRTTTRDLLALRDVLVRRTYAVRAPCLFRGDCPALERDVDWCHAELPWEPPPALAEIIAASGLHKEALKMSYLVLAPKGEAWAEPPFGRLFRVVSETLPGKSRLRVMGCGPEGRIPLALADSAHTPENDAFTTATRGDVLELDGAEPAMEGSGLRVTASTRVSLVARASEPLSASRKR